MMKQKVLIVFFIAILFVILTDCSNYEEIETTNPTIEQSSDKNAEETKTNQERRILNQATKEIFSVDLSKKGILMSSEESVINSSELILSNKKYYFPMLADLFDDEAWTINEKTAKDNIHQYLEQDGLQDISISNQDGLIMKVKNVYRSVPTISDEIEIVIINSISLEVSEQSKPNDWILPGGITAKSTAADILDVYGDPNTSTLFSKNSYSTEKELYYIEQVDSCISYRFLFNQDGTIKQVDISLDETTLQNNVIYKNQYFSMELPGFWRGRFRVEATADSFKFCFKEGGDLFLIYLLEGENPKEINPDSITVGTLKDKTHNYELVYKIFQDPPRPKGFEEEFVALSYTMFPQGFFEHLHPVDQYNFQIYDYGDYLGEYSDTGTENTGYRLVITRASLSEITFSYGYYAARAVEIKVGTRLSRNKGSFVAFDSYECPCDGYIRLEGGNVYISVVPHEPSETPSNLVTEGEQKLIKIEENKHELSKLVIDEKTKDYIGWTVTELEETFGTDYQITDKGLIYNQQPELCFETDGHMNERGKDEVVVKIWIKGHHDLGDGISSDMTVFEVAEIFGGTGYPEMLSDGSYFLGVLKDGYCYSFTWDSDFYQKSSSVILFRSGY